MPVHSLFGFNMRVWVLGGHKDLLGAPGGPVLETRPEFSADPGRPQPPTEPTASSPQRHLFLFTFPVTHNSNSDPADLSALTSDS